MRRTLNGAETSAFFLPKPSHRQGEKLRRGWDTWDGAECGDPAAAEEPGGASSRERWIDGRDSVICVSSSPCSPPSTPGNG